MKLTNKDRQQLEDILSRLNSVRNFIQRDNIVVATVTNLTAAPEDTFINKATGKQAIRLNKLVGSELNNLNHAIERMEWILRPETVESE